MIIYPAALVLSAAATATPLTHARIGWQTFTRDLAAADVTVSTEDADFPRDAPLRPDTAEAWAPTALPATWTVDLGGLQDIDYVGVVGGIGSAGCALEVHTSTGDLLGSPPEQVWDLFAAGIAPADDAPLLFLDDAVSARYVRLTLTGGALMPKVAVVYAGAVLAMQRAIYGGHSPIPLSRNTVLSNSLSKGGQFLGQGFRRHGVSGGMAYRYLTAAWYRSDFDPFVKAARQYPAFFGWRPETFPLECVYGWVTENIVPQNQGVRDFMSVSFGVQGIGRE